MTNGIVLLSLGSRVHVEISSTQDTQSTNVSHVVGPTPYTIHLVTMGINGGK